MDAMESIKQTFFQECEELLLALEEGLIAMAGGECDDETINSVFRSAHSIKGGGGAFGFDALVGFAHKLETVLDGIRSGKLEPTQDVVKVLLRAGDVLADHVNAVRGDSPFPEGGDADVAAELIALAGGEAAAVEAEADFGDLGFAPMQIQVDDNSAGEAPSSPAISGPSVWHIHFAPHEALYKKANEPYLLIRELAELGPVTVEADLSRLPDLASVNVEEAYFAWDIELRADVTREIIEEIFDFVTGDCDLKIRQDETAGVDDPMGINPVAAEPNPGTAPEPLPESAPAQNSPPPPRGAAAVPKKQDVPPSGGGVSNANQTIRVDLNKVDRLVNLVGELVISEAMLSQQVTDSDLPSTSDVYRGLSELDHLLRDLQESVMAIRTQPVKSVFQRMPRLVRELAVQTHKEARLLLDGEGTEVDKTVIDRLGEPLTHMIRNALDHGLETPEDREAAGKPREGTVTLSAGHRGGRIVIEITDDGRGVNRERVREKAIEKGLISEQTVLSNEETDNLIFLPGFSTASKVSDISGRGVGMDVVRRNVQDLGGRVVIASNPGKGSRFTMTLPLTLAVLDGMVVAVGDQTYVLPLSHIVESLQPRPVDLRRFGSDRMLLNIRNTYVPLVKVGELLGIESNQNDLTKGVVILVECEGTGRLALAVDSIIGQRQIVIKSFEHNYERIEGIAGATILGDGRVALILDVDGMVTRCRTQLAESQLQVHQEANQLAATGT